MAVCACGCGEAVRRRGRTGPAPIYSSATCRQRVYRARRQGFAVGGEPLAPPEVAVSAAPVAAQIQRAVLEARGVAFAFLRLGHVAQPTLAWRCTRAGEGMIAALVDGFGEGVR